MDIRKSIDEKLIAIGVDPKIIDIRLIKYFTALEEKIQEKEAYLKQALEDIKKSKYSAKSLCDEIDILSRSTLYNYDILKKYVEYSLIQTEKLKPGYQEKKEHETIKELKEKISLMEARDVDNLLLINENKHIKRELQSMEEEIQRLRARVMELSAKTVNQKGQKMDKNNIYHID